MTNLEKIQLCQEIVDQMKKRVVAMHRGVIISDERKAGYTQHEN